MTNNDLLDLVNGLLRLGLGNTSELLIYRHHLQRAIPELAVTFVPKVNGYGDGWQ